VLASAAAVAAVLGLVPVTSTVCPAAVSLRVIPVPIPPAPAIPIV
jgi:hypothetical protein